ncbi:MAG: GTPase HflX, partial [Eubacteriales bacterium]|nr:GTPase HflX [Eubacteriales bacterium]
MEENFESKQERAVLVGLNAACFTQEQTATEETLEELEALLETAGGFCTGKMLQNRPNPDPHSFIGEGKAQEVRMLAEATASTMVIFDNELSPGNIRALEEIIGLTVLDRSALIMDIFAQRAKTKEGRLQVELAQYKYLLPRLSGMGKSLSRQGGGIGTRGPGETKLESDRRHIRERITRLESVLAQVRQVRGVQRERRMKNSVPVVAMRDYTRSGTSRYGEAKDVQDTVVEYTMTQDKSFNGVVDKGDASEQAISNKSGQWLRQQIAERCVPTGDKYGFSQLAKYGHVSGVTAEPAKDTIVGMVYDAA